MRNPLATRVFWGNDDAYSTIRISVKQWNSILLGEDLTKSTWSYYEGLRNRVIWEFTDRTLNVCGDDGEDWIVDMDISEVNVYDLRTNKVFKP